MSYVAVATDVGGDPSNYQGPGRSPSPERADSEEPTKHRRNYQACEGCRTRKVKCDLGPVDAPHKPPCARCRRENKTCEFADTRKKRANSPSGSNGHDGNVIKRSRTISNSQDSSPYAQPNSTGVPPQWSPDQSSNTWTIPDHHSRTPPVNPPPQADRYRALPRASPPRSINRIVRPPATKETELSSRAASAFLNDPIDTSERSLNLLASAADTLQPGNEAKAFHSHTERKRDQPVSDTLRINSDGSKASLEQYNRVLQVWRRWKYVRLNIIKAEEAIAYVHYFYDKLQPMTPVVLPNYRDVGQHLELLRSEPVLSLAILTIASRYMQLSGPAAATRQYSIHEEMWKALTHKVQYLLWGQERFGGEGSSKPRELANGQLTWTGSHRTLGTIEALMLLTDWQPRALHFPPGNDDVQLLDHDFDSDYDANGSANHHSSSLDDHDNISSSWLAPAWRSDRMSWMLLNIASALASELGAYDDSRSLLGRDDPDFARKNRIRRLVTVYVAQTSGRIGIPSTVPFLENLSYLDSLSKHNDPVDVMQGLWWHIAGIMDDANKHIFPSREYTMNLTRGNEYRVMIERFAPRLTEWKRNFEEVRGRLSDVMACILMIEWEYARLYINSIGLQHVVESWVRPGPNAPSASNMTKSVHENKRYIDQFTEAALHILDIVCGRMKDYLRDAPVRIFLRTLSAMMFTLKRLSMGNHEKMVRKSIDLLTSVTKLLIDEVVDDVHLSGSTARMIQGILGRVTQTLIRVQKPVNTSGQPSREQSRAASPQADHSHHNQQRFMEIARSYEDNGIMPSAITSADPLANITARPMADLKDRTFIPPPDYNFNTLDFDLGFNDDTGIDHSVHSEQQADWFTLPLENLQKFDHTRVDQGQHNMGPMVGQHDMLEVLMEAPFDPNTMQWPAFGQEHFYHNQQ